MIHRTAIILFIISSLLFTKTFGQNFTRFDHKYAFIDNYLTLKFVDSNSYMLKTSMYGKNYFTGKYIMEADTLRLITFSFERVDSWSDSLDFKSIPIIFNRFVVKDSVLLPFLTLDEKFLLEEPRYTKEVDSVYYAQTDGHVNQYIIIRKENKYQYWSRSDVGPTAISNGSYKRDNDEIIFEPGDGSFYLTWFCTGNRMIFVENCLIGMRNSELIYYQRRKKRLQTKIKTQ